MSSEEKTRVSGDVVRPDTLPTSNPQIEKPSAAPSLHPVFYVV